MQKYDQVSCWGKNMIRRGRKRGGKYKFFPHSVKRFHIFSLIDLKHTKLQKKSGVERVKKADKILPATCIPSLQYDSIDFFFLINSGQA